MLVYSYPIYTLYQGTVPAELEGYIAPVVWADIVTRCYKIRSGGEAAACCIEWMVCLFTGFFCIFCCHPQIAGCFSENDTLQTERDINYRHFNGAAVVQIIGDVLRIDLDNIPGRQPVVAIVSAEPVATLAQATVVGEETKVDPAVEATPQTVQSIKLLLPNGGQHGQEIRFTTSDGVERRIFLKETVPAGGTVNIQY